MISAYGSFHSKIPNHFDLPRRINRLGELAYNLWWTWHPDAQRLFNRIDYDLWERLNHNPIRLLRELGALEPQCRRAGPGLPGAATTASSPTSTPTWRKKDTWSTARTHELTNQAASLTSRWSSACTRPCPSTRAAWACWRATT